MRIATRILGLTLIGQAHGKDYFIDTLVDKLVDKVIRQAWNVWPLRQIGSDPTFIGHAHVQVLSPNNTTHTQDFIGKLIDRLLDNVVNQTKRNARGVLFQVKEMCRQAEKESDALDALDMCPRKDMDKFAKIPRLDPRTTPLPDMEGQMSDEVASFEDILNSSYLAPGHIETVEHCLSLIGGLASQIVGPKAILIAKGSYAQGLALNSSDLDLALCDPTSQPTLNESRRSIAADLLEKEQAVDYLTRLVNLLKKSAPDALHSVQRLFSATVPILRFDFKASVDLPQITVDVSMGNASMSGACDRWIHCILGFDHLGVSAGLIRLVKHWATRRKLTDTFHGSLSSFAFVLLCVFFLQQSGRLPPGSALKNQEMYPGVVVYKDGKVLVPQPLPLPSGKDLELKFSSLLLEFFKWATQLEGHRICVETGNLTQLYGRDNNDFGNVMVVIVPTAPEETSNAARCLRRRAWQQVVQELRRAHRLTRHLDEQLRAGAQKSKAVVSLLNSLVAPRLKRERPRRDILAEELDRLERPHRGSLTEE